MKKILPCIFSCLFITAAPFAQADNAISIREKLAADTTSYHTFLDLGKASCMSDLFKRTKSYRKLKEWDLYRLHFVTLYDLQSPLARNFLDNDMKKAFSRHQEQHLEPLIQQYRTREEYFNIHRSPLLICSKLFAENETTKRLYLDFVGDTQNPIQENHPAAMKHWAERIGQWRSDP